MALFEPYDVDTMNEADVREIIVRPFLHALGYRQGDPVSRIRTEQTFRYGKAFLGRKNPSKDPDLVGRADYICEVVSVGRWVAEAKAPDVELTLEESEQAHTYNAHPEVAGFYFLLCNGRLFRLFQASRPEAAIMEWRPEETEALIMTIENVLGPDAIRKLVSKAIDVEKPLAKGFGSRIEVVGGHVTYERFKSSVPDIFPLDQMNGFKTFFKSGEVLRLDDGRIQANTIESGPTSALQAFNEMLGMDVYTYSCSDEYISTDVRHPTIFQNVTRVDLPPGITLPAFPGAPQAAGPKLPVGIFGVADTEATGFIEGEYFKGVFKVHYDIAFTGSSVGLLRAAGFPADFTIEADGQFEVRIR